MSSNQKATDQKDQNDIPDYGERPKYKSSGQSKYFVGDKVYLIVGSSRNGPYVIEKVVRRKVYTLSYENGDAANDGLEVVEAELEKA
ncbi:hypothetical protein BDZ45DRAFT_679219 [Acephala macrosclerotiorum]|nr:hypothetical protein BDZ45DRAFT_679219 [Acephala macrosclerotiorum]